MKYNYLPADESFVVNNGHPKGIDRDSYLKPIRVLLPEPPPLELIEGYGLPPKEQRWRPPKMPDKLTLLQKKIIRDFSDDDKQKSYYVVVDRIWEEIENNQEDYKDEIEWIKYQWYYRTQGYWFFNNGKPTYITGWHWFFLSYWHLEGVKLPEYRDRTRRTFLFWDYISKTRESFKYLDADGNAISNDDGTYDMIEMPVRTFYGVGQGKGRREGVSNMSQAAQFETCSREQGAIGAIFSMNATSAYKLFYEKTVQAFSKIPFFFLPKWDGYFKQSTSIDFENPKNVTSGLELKSAISYAQSAFGDAYDGGKLRFAIFDESGKTKDCDITKRWDTHKRGLALGEGASIFGFCIHPSTTEDMELKGGANYQKFLIDSDFYNRNPVNGQTKTGCANIFLPFYDGMESFIDPFGNSIIDEPTDEQIKTGFKFRTGSYQFLKSGRDRLLNSKDPRDMVKYREMVVKQPFNFMEMFSLSSGNPIFNLDIVNKRCSELATMPDPYIRGNFEFTGEEFNSDVRFIPCSDGRCEVSLVLSPEQANLRHKEFILDRFTGEQREVWAPNLQHIGVVGVDPYKSSGGDKKMAAKTGYYASDGGIAAFKIGDKYELSEEALSFEYPRFVVVYRNRPLSKIFYKDAIAIAQYYGFMIYPETNVDQFLDFVSDHNYDGYFLYDWDENKMDFKQKPGVFQLTASKEIGWDEIRNYIEFRGHKERHSSLLKEFSQLSTFEDLGRNDMAAAALCALLGARGLSRRYKRAEMVEETNGYDDWASMDDDFML